MRKEPNRIRLGDAPLSSKPITKIPMPPIYDIRMEDDTYIKPDTDSRYIKINNENFLENSTKSIQNLEAESSN
jgi:hypothetical protein